MKAKTPRVIIMVLLESAARKPGRDWSVISSFASARRLRGKPWRYPARADSNRARLQPLHRGGGAAQRHLVLAHHRIALRRTQRGAAQAAALFMDHGQIIPSARDVQEDGSKSRKEKR